MVLCQPTPFRTNRIWRERWKITESSINMLYSAWLCFFFSYIFVYYNLWAVVCHFGIRCFVYGMRWCCFCCLPLQLLSQQHFYGTQISKYFCCCCWHWTKFSSPYFVAWLAFAVTGFGFILCVHLSPILVLGYNMTMHHGCSRLQSTSLFACTKTRRYHHCLGHRITNTTWEDL